jgi:hypothetical protein
MSAETLLYQLVLFAHLFAFAFALSAVLREDLRLLRTRRIDLPRLARTARALTVALILLWATGIALVALAVQADPAAWPPGAKLSAKLVVVAVLSANGLLLHALALPRISRNGSEVSGQPLSSQPLWILAVGAVSTASWLSASLIGAARHVAQWLSFGDFMRAYGLIVIAALLCATALRWAPPRPAVPGRSSDVRHGRRATDQPGLTSMRPTDRSVARSSTDCA